MAKCLVVSQQHLSGTKSPKHAALLSHLCHDVTWPKKLGREAASSFACKTQWAATCKLCSLCSKGLRNAEAFLKKKKAVIKSHPFVHYSPEACFCTTAQKFFLQPWSALSLSHGLSPGGFCYHRTNKMLLEEPQRF